jgi:Spy/CpxP family protein refolding chaperone
MSGKQTRFFGVLAVLTILALTVFAQQGRRPGPPPGGPDGPPPMGPGGPGRHGLFGPMERELNLTDEQKAQIKTLREAFETKTATLREQMFQAKGEPFAGLKDGEFDEAAIRAAAQKRAAAQVELEVEHARFMSQAYAVLTAEQKAKLAELRQKFEQNRPSFPPPSTKPDDSQQPGG